MQIGRAAAVVLGGWCVAALLLTPCSAVSAAEGATAVAAQAAAAQPAKPEPQKKIRWAAQYSPDGKTVAVSSGTRSAGNSGELALLDASTGAELVVIERDLGIRTVAFSPDGKLLALGDFEGAALLVDAVTLKEVAALPPRELPIYAVAFTPDGKTLLTGCLDGTVTFWDVEKGAVRQSLDLPGEQVTGVAVARDSRTLAVSTRSGKVQLRDAATLAERHTLEASPAPNAKVRVVEAIAFSPDSKLLVSGSWDRTLRFWNVETGTVVREIPEADSAIHVAVFSPDGQNVATGDGRGGVHVWNVEAGALHMKLSVHSYRVFGLSYSPDGQMLASASWNGAAQIWDVEKRAKARELYPKNEFGNQTPQEVRELLPVVRSEFKFLVTTPQNKPLAGAKVVPSWYVLAMGVSAAFPDGAYPPLTTDAEGMVRIAAPEAGDSPAITRTRQAFKSGMTMVNVSVEHPDYPAATFRSQTELDRVALPEPATIAIRAHRENETQLVPDLELMFNSRAAPAFSNRSVTDGILTLRNVDLSTQESVRQMRVVHFPAQGPALFSEPIALPQREQMSLEFDVTLKPGVRVEGRLSDEVPRPIRQGKVAAGVIRRFTATNYVSFLFLTASAEITPDGSFVFESLPTGETLQMVALCEGWVSTPASNAEIQKFAAENDLKNWNESSYMRTQVLPQLASLRGEVIQPVIAMAKTSSCEVRVLDEQGRPVPEIHVVCYPNHHFLSGGSSMLGQVLNSLDRQQLKYGTGELRRPVLLVYPPSPYSGKTDANGVVVISGLPTGSGSMEHRFAIARDLSEPYSPARQQHIVTIFAGKDASTTIRLRPSP